MFYTNWAGNRSTFSFFAGGVLSFTFLFTHGLPLEASADRGPGDGEHDVVFSVFHGPTTTVLANPDSNGHQLGDLRVVSLPTVFGSGDPAGRLDATLITTGIDVPLPDDEIRISSLIFVFGRGVDQIVVNGSGFYPAAGGTIDLDSTLIRPVTGGSGRFASMNGWAESRHFANDTWEHTFHLIVSEKFERRRHHRDRRKDRQRR